MRQVGVHDSQAGAAVAADVQRVRPRSERLDPHLRRQELDAVGQLLHRAQVDRRQGAVCVIRQDPFAGDPTQGCPKGESIASRTRGDVASSTALTGAAVDVHELLVSEVVQVACAVELGGALCSEVGGDVPRAGDRVVQPALRAHRRTPGRHPCRSPQGQVSTAQVELGDVPTRHRGRQGQQHALGGLAQGDPHDRRILGTQADPGIGAVDGQGSGVRVRRAERAQAADGLGVRRVVPQLRGGVGDAPHPAVLAWLEVEHGGGLARHAAEVGDAGCAQFPPPQVSVVPTDIDGVVRSGRQGPADLHRAERESPFDGAALDVDHLELRGATRHRAHELCPATHHDGVGDIGVAEGVNRLHGWTVGEGVRTRPRCRAEIDGVP